MMISSVNVNSSLFWRVELKDNVCYIFSYQKYIWKLPHINSLLNVWEIALWKQTFFTEDIGRTLRSITSSRPALFLKIHLCKNKRERSSVRNPPFFFIVFVWATRRRTVERSWHLHSIYPILTAARYLPESWNLSKQTMTNRKKQFSRHMRLKAYLRWSHKITSPKSSSKIVEKKHNLMNMCTTLSASRLFHHILISAWSGSTPYHIALSNNISSDRSS